jgi:Fe-S cluster biogenesis protein NfuA
MTNEEKVENIISKIRPYIQMHGGDVMLEKIENKVITLVVSGACSHCSLASMTYNNLIGGLLKEDVPELELEIIYQ